MLEYFVESLESRLNWHARIRASLRRRGRSGVRESEALKEATLGLAAQALEARDLAIARHSARVADLAARLAMQLALGRRWIELMRIAGSLHDLGVISVRDDILNKTGPLREDEWEVMRRHPDVGADLVSQHSTLAPIASLIRHHHEYWDGSGYPAGLRREDIPMGARILAVAESFDTITNPRIYRRDSLSSEGAIHDIREHAGSWYDPSVVDSLDKLFSYSKSSMRRG